MRTVLVHRSRENLGSIVTRLLAGRPVFDSRQKQGIFCLRHCGHTGSGPQPIVWVPRSSFPRGGGTIPSKL